MCLKREIVGVGPGGGGGDSGEEWDGMGWDGMGNEM